MSRSEALQPSAVLAFMPRSRTTAGLEMIERLQMMARLHAGAPACRCCWPHKCEPPTVVGALLAKSGVILPPSWMGRLHLHPALIRWAKGER